MPVQYNFQPGKPLPKYQLPKESEYSKNGPSSWSMITEAFNGLQDWCDGAIKLKKNEFRTAAEKAGRETDVDRFTTGQRLQRFAFVMEGLRDELDCLKAQLDRKDGRSFSGGSDEEVINIDADLLEKLSNHVNDEVYDDDEEAAA